MDIKGNLSVTKWQLPKHVQRCRRASKGCSTAFRMCKGV